MVRARVYRHDVRCPDCGSNWMRKDGFSGGKQRYCCGDCQRRYLPAGAYRRPAAEVKERALAIRRMADGRQQPERHRAGLGIQYPGGEPVGEKGGQQALSRLRERSERRVQGMAGRQPALVVSCDEMWTYRGVLTWGAAGGLAWVWTAVVREADGRRWVDFEVGDRSEAPFLRLYERLPEAGLYRRDAYPVYLGWLPNRTGTWWARAGR